MPVISMFFGIIVQLFAFDNDRHKVPHIHKLDMGNFALRLI